KDVVAEDQSAMAACNECTADDERLGEAIRARLRLVLEVQSPLMAIAEQSLEARRFLRRRNDQNLSYPRQHQGAQRIVDHRLVVDGQQLFRNRLGDRIKPRSGAPGKYNAPTRNWRAHHSGVRSSRDMHHW